MSSRTISGVWAWHQTLTDPDHLRAADLLRRTRIGALRPMRGKQVEQRALTDYDTALGISLDADVHAEVDAEGGCAS